MGGAQKAVPNEFIGYFLGYRVNPWSLCWYTYKGNEMRRQSSGHLHLLTNPEELHNTQFSTAEAVREFCRSNDIDGIVVCGVSGLIVGPVVSYLTNLPLVVVRKPKMGHVAYINKDVEASLPGETYLMIDDMVDEGNTFNFVDSQLKDRGCKLIGCFAYLDDEFYMRDDVRFDAGKLHKFKHRFAST